MDVRRTLTGQGSRIAAEPDGVVRHLLQTPADLLDLMSCFDDQGPVVPMRAADALEKLCRLRPLWVVPHIDWLLDHVAHIDNPAVRWHVAQMLRELPLTEGQRHRAVDVLTGYLAESRDLLVLTHSLESLTALIRENEGLAGEAAATLASHLARLARCRVTSLARRAERLTRHLVDLGHPVQVTPGISRSHPRVARLPGVHVGTARRRTVSPT